MSTSSASRHWASTRWATKSSASKAVYRHSPALTSQRPTMNGHQILSSTGAAHPAAARPGPAARDPWRRPNRFAIVHRRCCASAWVDQVSSSIRRSSLDCCRLRQHCKAGIREKKYPDGSRSGGTLRRTSQYLATDCGGSALLRRSPLALAHHVITATRCEPSMMGARFWGAKADLRWSPRNFAF
jgi:hypothetical protein